MTARTTTAEPEYDFDNWSEEAETKALQALNDVKYIIVEQTFVGRFSDGEIVKLPLAIKLSTIDELQRDFATPLDQFKHLVRTFFDPGFADSLADRPLIPVAIMSEKFFRCLARAQELAFPES